MQARFDEAQQAAQAWVERQWARAQQLLTPENRRKLLRLDMFPKVPHAPTRTSSTSGLGLWHAFSQRPLDLLLLLSC